MGAGPTEKYHQVLNDYFVMGSLTCLKPEVLQEKLSADFPLMLNIEPTNACNARCWYCPREITAEKHGVHFMDKDLYRHIVDQIPPHHLIMINYHKDGEPLLNRDLPWMVGYAKEKEAAEILHLNTNGILLSGLTAKGILEQGIDDITVSIDAARESTYQELKRIKGLDRVERGVRDILEYRDRIGASTRIRVKLIEFDAISMDEIEEFRMRWEGLADQVQVMGSHSWGGAIDGIKVTDASSPVRYSCALLWYLMAINASGTVSKCNYDWNYSGLLGDARTQPLKEIWQGQKAKACRKAHLDGRWDFNEVCKTCVAWVPFTQTEDILKDRDDFV